MVASLVPPAPALAAPLADQAINSMRWEDRVLLVFAPRESDAALGKQRRIVGAAMRGFGKRALRVVEVIGESVSGARDYAPRLRQRYRIAQDDFVALLIGREGEIKLRANRPLGAEQLFETIDLVPMRGAEMPCATAPIGQTAVLP